MEIFSSGLPLYHHSCGVGHGAAPALGAPELGTLSCSGFLASGGPCVFDFRETWPGWITGIMESQQVAGINMNHP